MNAMTDMPAPLVFTDAAAAKVKTLIDEEGNTELKLRVFVTGGGCSGFQYGFTFDETVNEDDTSMQKNGVTLLIDPMSYQYLVGAEIDYQEGFAAVGRHDQIVGAIEQRFGGLVDSLTLRGDGVGQAGEVPPDLVQDIRHVPHPYRGQAH